MVPDTRPEVVLYENHPLRGIEFARSLNDKEFDLAAQEVSLLGMPYFFSNEQKNKAALAYNWQLNNNALSQEGNEVIFRKPEGVTEGRSRISLGIKNLERFMQDASGSLNVVFQNTAETPTSQPIF